MAVIDFTKLDLIFDKIARLDQDKIWLFSVDRDVQEEIIRLNTEDQLEEFGIDSKGVQLGIYKQTTVSYKIQKGQRYDHVTLKDTGKFYNSFNIRVNVNEIVLDADDTTYYDMPLFDVWGVDVLGLTDENMEYIKKMILENYVKYIYNELLR
jgi:hypothetical protein